MPENPKNLPSPESSPRQSRCRYCHEPITWRKDKASGYAYPESGGIDHRMSCAYMEKIRNAIGTPGKDPEPKPEREEQDILHQFKRIDTDLSYVRKIIDPILTGEVGDAVIITVMPNGIFRSAFVGDPRRAICYLEHTKAQILKMCYGEPQADDFDDYGAEDDEY